MDALEEVGLTNRLVLTVETGDFMSSNAGSNLPDSLFEGDTNLISSPTAHLNWMVDPFLYAQPEMRIC